MSPVITLLFIIGSITAVLVTHAFDMNAITAMGVTPFLDAIIPLLKDPGFLAAGVGATLSLATWRFRTYLVRTDSPIPRYLNGSIYLLLSGVYASIYALFPIAFWMTYKDTMVSATALAWLAIIYSLFLMESAISSATNVMNGILGVKRRISDYINDPFLSNTVKPSKNIDA